MVRPQQPEAARSGRTDVDPDHAAATAEVAGIPATTPDTGPVPVENRPGHHPPVEQDRPDLDEFAARFGVTPEPSERSDDPAREAEEAVAEFGFAFDSRYRLSGWPFRIAPNTARVEIDAAELRVWFGPWRLRTPRTNITGAETTGPYALLKTIGPPHVSLKDRGLTFATNSAAGLCIRFAEPVPGIEPSGWLRHPALTVTVEDPDGMARALGFGD